MRSLVASRRRSVLTAVLFGVSRVEWSQALIPDVYTLNSFFIVLIVWLAVLWRTGRISLLWLAFAYGLSLTHHRTMIWFAPALVFFVLFGEGRALFQPKRLLDTDWRISPAFLALSLHPPAGGQRCGCGISRYKYRPNDFCKQCVGVAAFRSTGLYLGAHHTGLFALAHRAIYHIRFCSWLGGNYFSGERQNAAWFSERPPAPSISLVRRRRAYSNPRSPFFSGSLTVKYFSSLPI